MKAILHYLEESWLGKAQNRVVGVIYKYDPDNDSITRVKDVPDEDVLARIEGSWHDQIQFTPSGSSVRDFPSQFFQNLKADPILPRSLKYWLISNPCFR